MAERDIVIDHDKFPGNSNKDKEERKAEDRPKQDKIVQGSVRRSKPSIFSKVAESFFSEAANEEDLKTTIIFDYLIPTIKDTIVEMGKMFLDGIFYGSTSTHKQTASNKPYRVSYSGYYDQNKSKPASNRITSRNFYEFIFENEEGNRSKARKDAEDTLNKMIEIADQYSTASVADFCEMAGIDGEWTDNNYGWHMEDLVKKTKVVGAGRGYKIIFPEPRSIKDE